MGEVVAEKMKEQQATWFQDETSWFWQLIKQIWPFTDTAVASKKVLSFYGDRQPLSAENFVLYFWYDWCPALDYEWWKTKEAIGVFFS